MTDQTWEAGHAGTDHFDPFDPFDPRRRDRASLGSYLDRRERPWWEPTSATVSHLVFVEGRLVEAWQEPADGTEWARYVTPPPPPPPPPRPPEPALHERVRAWLVEVCGSEAAVDGLSTARLERCRLDEQAPPTAPECRERVQAAAELLDELADHVFEPEVGDAFRWALVALWREDPLTITRPASPAVLASGVAWAVGKANGLFSPVGVVRVGAILDHVGTRAAPSSAGRAVAVALRGFHGSRTDRQRPWELPDLLPLARTDVLTGPVRERLVRIRDRAAAAAAA